MKNIKLLFVLFLSITLYKSQAQTLKALFDNTKNETAGNADWIIDTDQPIPVPAQSGITSSTAENYWLGAISAWGVDLVKRGFTVHTLTSTYGITYGNASNPYDLSNYNLFIVCEPQSPFSTAEKTAIKNFVRNGGGLMMVADHNASDRNSDGWDSPMVWNDLRTDSLFGIHFQSASETDNNITGVYTNIETVTDTIINGAAGTVTALSYHNGTSMRLTSSNPYAKGHIWINGATHGTSKIVAATSHYGLGKVAGVGDSSPADDGSAQPGNSSIYNGWTEAGATDNIVFLNMCMWLVSTQQSPVPGQVSLSSPNDLSTGISIPVTFKWRQTAMATNYQFDISTSNTFSTILLTDSSLIDTQKIISNLSLNTTYYWRARAKNANGWGQYSLVRSLTTWNVPPVVQLDVPADIDSNLVNPILFRWYTIPEVTNYKLEIATDINFTTSVKTDSTLIDTVLSVNDLVSGNYYWHVSAKNVAGWGNPSTARSFSMLRVPSKVLLLSPANRSNGVPDTINFSWQKLSGVSKYNFQLAQSPSFAQVTLEDSTLTDSTITVTGLDSVAKYYWRVQAQNPAGWGAFSDVWMFTRSVSQTVSHRYNSGWNIISIPFNQADERESVLFSSAISSAFYFDSGYVPTETLKVGSGYWLKLDSAETFTFTGSPVLAETLYVKAGWNLIGSSSSDVPINSITTIPSNILSSGYFKYDGAYTSVDTLQPMMGYWIKSKQQGKLIWQNLNSQSLANTVMPKELKSKIR